MSVSDEAMRNAAEEVMCVEKMRVAGEVYHGEESKRRTGPFLGGQPPPHYGESVEKMREESKMHTGPYLRGQDRLPNAAAKAGSTAARCPTMNSENVDSVQVGGTHYKDMAMQPWEVMDAMLTKEEFVGYLKGSIIKYVMRDGKKTGANDDQDKAKHYIAKLKSILEKPKW
jgi:hypothetical protein